MIYHLGTKAETLQKLYGNLKDATVLPQFIFTVSQWEKSVELIRDQYQRLPWNQCVIVRSSSLSEDTASGSLAGKYESIPNVCGMEQFEDAVRRVIASYDDNDGRNQILIQPMLQDVSMCGVAFTVDPNTRGHYYVINYNERGSTSAVTSGEGEKGNRLYYRFKQSMTGTRQMDMLCRTLEELEKMFDTEYLDVEFAFDNQEVLYILQVRPLCVREKSILYDGQKLALERVAHKIGEAQKHKPYLCGDKTIYSVMTDWNPAEMIGIRPKPLALSLYREIITDSVWAYQRDNYGYRNLRSFPLMVDFCGLPYIDVRVSFNSFIPEELDEVISEKLVNYYIKTLEKDTSKHDKAEFEIVFSCYTLDLLERIQVLRKHGFSEEEVDKIASSLRNVTNRIIEHKEGLWRKDYRKIEVLNQRYETITASDMGEIEKVYWLLEDCKRYGTLPFAGLARAAFIAVQLLQSLMKCGIISKEDYDAFMNSVSTVSTDMNVDFRELSKSAFLIKYGHLRPGTYDICLKRYDEAPELYFEWEKETEPGNRKKELFRLSLSQLQRLKEELNKNELSNDVLDLLDFVKMAIEGREYGKFIFTRNLSKALWYMEQIGMKEGITREEMAFVNSRVIQELYASSDDIQERLKDSIAKGKRSYEMTAAITLPPVIVSQEDVFQFYYPNSEPNYITQGTVQGEILLLENSQYYQLNEGEIEFEGKIVLIPSADPGYDWVFLHAIKGMITMYGGANSHMAIRAGELGIPAAVGVGTGLYDQLRRAKALEINAENKRITILR